MQRNAAADNAPQNFGAGRPLAGLKDEAGVDDVDELSAGSTRETFERGE